MEWSLKEKATCQILAEVLCLLNIFCVMKIIIWNSRGALKPNFQKHVRELVRVHDLAVFVVMETYSGGERAKNIRIGCLLMGRFMWI